MAFNLQTWRDQCKAYLKDLKQRIADRKVDSIYGTIAAAALWPVIVAFQQGDLSALVALGQVLAGVGTNLLAGGLQSWRDQAEAARDLQARIEKEPALREELDAIVEKLDAIALAKAELPEKERQWFVDTLQQELQKLGNLPRFEATLRGVIVGRDLQKSVVVTGDNNSVTYIINQYNTNNLNPADPEALRRHIADYLTWMRDRCGTIELRGIKREGQQVVQLDLETVYVPLQAQAYVKVEKKKRSRAQDEPPVARTIKMQQVLEQGQRLVITGGPGCGKTTVLMHIAWTLVAAMASDDSAYAQKRLGIAGDLPLPIFVPLSAYATHLRQLPANTDPRQRTLAAFLSEYLIARQSSFDLPREFFQQLLRQGQAVILLLDGLDEVPNEDARARVRQAIEELVTGRDHMRVVVTCRSAAYKDRTALGKIFAKCASFLSMPNMSSRSSSRRTSISIATIPSSAKTRRRNCWMASAAWKNSAGSVSVKTQNLSSLARCWCGCSSWCTSASASCRSSAPSFT